MKIRIPLFAASTWLALLMASPSIAQTNVEPPLAPAAAVPATPALDATPPNAATVESQKKGGGPKAKPGNARIDPAGVHLGHPGGMDIITPFGPGGQEGWSKIISLAAILSPFVTLMAIFALVLHFRLRRRVVLHETLRAMIEKGLPIPPELISGGADGVWGGRPRSAHRDLRGGLVLLGLGIALFFLSGKWGIIPGVIGVALLIVWCFERWEKSKLETNP